MPVETDTNETKALEEYLKDPRNTYILETLRKEVGTPYDLEVYFHPFEDGIGEETLYDAFARESYDWDNVDWEAVFQSCLEE